MKNYIILLAVALLATGCTKIDEQIDVAITSAKTSVQQKTKDVIQEKLENSLTSLSTAENTDFRALFTDGNYILLSDFKGKRVDLPTGSPAYLFAYKANKDELLTFLERQRSTDEAHSDQKARKTDGHRLLSKLSLVEKLLPDNTLDLSFLNHLRDDESIEYYKLKRLPASSTIIYNPKTKQIYHFVEIKKG